MIKGTTFTTEVPTAYQKEYPGDFSDMCTANGVTPTGPNDWPVQTSMPWAWRLTR